MSEWDSNGEFTGDSGEVSLDNDTMGMIQYGEIQQPGFFGNQELKNSNVAFNNGVNRAYAFAGVARSLKSLKAPTNYVRTEKNYLLTDAEKALIVLKAKELSFLGVVPYDNLELFFYILACVDNLNDLLYIGRVVGIEEMGQPIYIKNIRGILALPEIYKVGYLANAVASIDNIYANKFARAQSHSEPKNSSYNNVLNAVSSIAGLLGSADSIINGTGGNAVGGFFSELVTGTRISTAKQANNPMLVGPSYGGKAFFGEAPVSLPAVDQMYCRRVAAFTTENGGSGTSSFQMQNFGSFGGAQNITSVISRMVTGSTSPIPSGSALSNTIQTLAGNVCNILGASTSSNIEMKRHDNAIPFMIGMSAALSNETHSPFDSKIFTNGWKLANSAGNDIQKVNPQYMQVCKTSL